IAKKACLKGFGNLVVGKGKGTKVSMTRMQPFGKVAGSLASQQETKFSVRFLVRFPQTFIASLFHAFLKLVSGHSKAW
ncbi:hypothetical protein AVEN_116128-1, partial [Araneus ventricosus]